ncbi:MAG TPA: hypothetical protein VH601_02110 [Bryobacteraceae bacterium]|jgi:hypothetical protein
MFDPPDQARQVAQTFARMSRSMDTYIQDHFEELTPDQLDFLSTVTEKLDDTHDRFIAMAIRGTLDSLKDDLSEIAAITGRAEQALKHLNKVAKVAEIAGALAELSADIATADYGAIPSALTNLAEAIPDKE